MRDFYGREIKDDQWVRFRENHPLAGNQYEVGIPNEEEDIVWLRPMDESWSKAFQLERGEEVVVVTLTEKGEARQ